MKLYKAQNGDIYGLLKDGSQDYLIEPDFVLLTGEELDRLENPTKYMSEDEKLNLYRQSLKALTKKQFNLYIYDNNLLSKLELLFEANPRIKIEFDSVTTIDRISSIVDCMKIEFSWTEEKVDELWTEALAIY